MCSKASLAEIITQDGADWGLARISQSSNFDFFNPRYSYGSTAGDGVNFYVLSSGVRTSHNDFDGRATWGSTIIGRDHSDTNGTGTQCAAKIVGRYWGVAKKASVIVVKTLYSGGNGVNIVSAAGVKWALADHRKKADTASSNFKGSVIFLDPGITEPSDTTDSLIQAINTAVEAGVQVVIPAGNNDTGSSHPMGPSKAVIVGATDIFDKRASFSNWGPTISLFAPGVQIDGPSYHGDYAIDFAYSTEIAAAHVAGILAYLLSLQPGTDVKSKLLKIATRDVLDNVPKGTPNVSVCCVDGNLARTDDPSFLLTTELKGDQSFSESVLVVVFAKQVVLGFADGLLDSLI